MNLLKYASQVFMIYAFKFKVTVRTNWLSSVLRPLQHSIIGYTGDGFYRSKDPTDSIKVLKEKAVKENKKPSCR